MIGNILIAIVFIFYGLLTYLMLNPKPGGDYGVGYSFGLLIYGAGFILFTGLLAWNMNLNQSFDWMPISFLRHRNWIIFFGWILFAVAIFWSLEYHTKWIEGEFPQFMRWLALTKVYFWLPLLVFVPCLYLLNVERLPNFAPDWVKITILIGFITSVLIGFGIFYGFVKANVQHRIALAQAAKNELDPEGNNSWAFNSSMEYINNYKESTIQGLLMYTHREKEERLRQASLAKIKTYEDWESELVHILEQGELNEKYWVFAFLDGNQIEHPENFIQPIKQSIGLLAPALRESLKDPYSLTLGYINIEALCRVLETQFKESAPEFRQNMLSLQNALGVTAPDRNNKEHKPWFDETLNASRLSVNRWLECNK